RLASARRTTPPCTLEPIRLAHDVRDLLGRLPLVAVGEDDDAVAAVERREQPAPVALVATAVSEVLLLLILRRVSLEAEAEVLDERRRHEERRRPREQVGEAQARALEGDREPREVACGGGEAGRRHLGIGVALPLQDLPLLVAGRREPHN